MSFWYFVVYSLMIGIVAGVVAAFVWFLIINWFKPKIKIGEVIGKTTLKFDEKEDESKVYLMKFINYTKPNIENVSIDLFLMFDYFHGNHKNYRVKRLKLRNDSYKFISGLREKNHEMHNNCVQIVILDDLEERWTGENAWLHLQITTYHSRSGSRKVFVQKFTNPNVIQEGEFCSGHTFEIMPSDKKRHKKVKPSA
ncbi:hypothetical protein ES708_32929 [subsurface metagenome]